MQQREKEAVCDVLGRIELDLFFTDVCLELYLGVNLSYSWNGECISALKRLPSQCPDFFPPHLLVQKHKCLSVYFIKELNAFNPFLIDLVPFRALGTE